MHRKSFFFHCAFLKGIAAVFLTVLLAAGCAPNNGDPTVYDMGTKAGIEAFIADHWQEYGYAAKPTKYIALSFDDGPCPASDFGGTAAMLEALEMAKVKATFFVVGSRVNSYKTEAKAIVNAGHEIGNHSNGFDSLGSAAISTITNSLNATTDAIKDVTGVETTMFRAPNVDYGSNLTQVCTTLGFPIIGVRVWSNDYDNSVTTEKVISNVLANPKDGDIINCHESNTSKGKTMTALPVIVSGLREKGFWIMTVGELAIVKEVTLQAGVRYDTIPKDN